MFRRLSALLPLALIVLVQCSPHSEEPSSPASLESVVTVTLTPAAIAALASKGETAVLHALYFGIPTDSTASMADPSDGGIHLAKTEQTLASKDSQSLTLTGKDLDPAKFELISQGRPILHLKAYASKNGKQTETLECSDHQDYVDVLQKTPVTLRCDISKL